MDNRRLTNTVFLEEIAGSKIGWYKDFIKVCTLLEFTPPGDLTRTINLRKFLEKCNVYHQKQWKYEVEQQSKLAIYNSVITMYGNTNLLKGIFVKEERSLLCQLFCGNLKLSIETGRYNNIPRNERICKVCKEN